MSAIPLGARMFFALLAATLIVAVLVVRERDPDLALEVISGLPDELHPVGAQGPREAEITFFVRESDDDALVAIVDSREDIVRILDREIALIAGEQVSYRWDGSTDAGSRAAPGRYRLLVELPSEDREMVWPRRITLGSPAPEPGPGEVAP